MSLLFDIFLPTNCLLCDALGNRICFRCEGDLGSEPRLVFREGFVGFSAASYNMVTQKLLRSYKELGESELSHLMASSMLPLVQCFDHLPDFLVPVPSNRSALRERGFNPAELLARDLSLGLPKVRWVNLLSRARETRDQSKLNPAERRANQTGSMVSKVGAGRVLLVDDVVTTGATLLTAKQTLENAGFFVEGFITYAETEGKKVYLDYTGLSCLQMEEHHGTKNFR